MVHHIGHIWHVEGQELFGVLENNVAEVGDEHVLSQSTFQISEEPERHASPTEQNQQNQQHEAALRAEGSPFAGRHHLSNVGEQNVVLRLRQTSLQLLRYNEVVHGHAEAPQVGRF